MPVQSAAKRSWYRIENAASSDSAEIYLYDMIGGWGVSAADFVADLRAVTAKTVKLHINSPGGDAFDGIAIYNALKSKDALVEVFVDALAASAASIVAMAGARVVMAPASRLMIHQASVGMWGNADDLEFEVSQLRQMDNDIASIYTERAGGEQTDWLARMSEETWYTGQQAIDAGLADEIGRDVSNKQALRAVALFDLSKFKHAPEFGASRPAAVARPSNDVPSTTVAAQLASCVYDGFTDCVQDLMEDMNVSIAEGVAITALLGPMLTSLEDGLGDLGARIIPDDDEDDDDDDEMPGMTAKADVLPVMSANATTGSPDVSDEIERLLANTPSPRR